MKFFVKNNFFTILITYNLIIFLISTTNITSQRFLEESNNLNAQKTIIYTNEPVSEYLSNYVDEEGNLFLVTTATKSTKNRLVYALNAKGRNYFLNSNVKILEFSSSVDNFIINTFTIVYDKIKYLVIFDSSKNFQLINLANFITNSTSYDTSGIISQYNTIIPNGDNTFYMCHLSERNFPYILHWTIYLEYSKFEFTNGKFKNEALINKKDEQVSEPADSLSCFKSQNFI